MIDYLEQMFVIEQPKEEEKPEMNFRFSPLQEEPVEEMAYPVLTQELREERGQTRGSEAEFWQAEGIRRVERALTEPPAPARRLDSTQPEGMPGVSVSWEEPESSGWAQAATLQPGAAQAQEPLEHRLRRESRRYDSGFFWY